MSMPPDTYHLAVPTTHVVYSEILSVTSAMRKNARWATPTAYYPSQGRASLASSMGLRPGTQAGASANTKGHSRREFDLMLGFEDLKRDIRGSSDPSTMPLSEILSPFLSLIRSPLATAPITSAALNALHAFFVCGFISPNSPGIQPALAELSTTVSHSKFESGTSAVEEAVIFRIISVIHICICGSVGSFLGDVEVCEMLETVLTTCCQIRLSEVLRRSAEYKMQDLVRVIVQRLNQLDPNVEEKNAEVDDPLTPKADLKMNVSSTAEFPHETIEEALLRTEKATDPSPIPLDTTSEVTPYGLASITELMRVLINLLDPNDHLHTDSMRVSTLGILKVAFESAGPRIGDFPVLRSMVVDQGCKFLFLLARSDNPSVLSLSLRVIATVFETMRPHLKLQQELLLSFLIDKLGPVTGTNSQPRTKLNLPSKGNTARVSSATSSTGGTDRRKEAEDEETPKASRLVAPAKGETRELMLETLGHLSRYPEFMVDVWLNYDCDSNCEDLFERMIAFLTKNVQTTDHQQRSAQFLCLDLLLAFVQHMAERAAQPAAPWSSEYPPLEEVLNTKEKKRLLLTGATRFNKSPKTGIAFFKERGFVNETPESLAIFLKNTPRLDKRLLGDFISKPDNSDILNAFMTLFDFKGKPVAESMREMLESFRLPGESQQIERITGVFAEKYYVANTDSEIKSSDAVHVLSFSIIMLNTDLHNANLKKRMTLEDYQRNLRGVNENTDFSPEFLKEIYDTIRKREIVMPEEHVGQLNFDYAWKELLKRAHATPPLVLCKSSALDAHMFKLVWEQVVSATAIAFTTIDDDYIIEKAISGFRQCATLASTFQLPEVFDFIVLSLSYATGLLEDSVPPRTSSFPVVEVEGQSITVSPLSVKFGTSLRAQLAAVVMFTISNGNGNYLKDGWAPIFEMLQTLFLHSLLPTRMLQMEDFLGGVRPIPLAAPKPQQSVPRSDGGLLSALSSYLMTPYGSSEEALLNATAEEVELTLSAIDCISACKVDELYREIMSLELEPLLAALRALQSAADRRTVQRLRALLEEVEGAPPTPSQPGRTLQQVQSLRYDPSSVFLLEMMLSIASQAKQYLEDVWPIIFEHLSALLSQAHHYSILLIERAVVGLLKLCQLASDQPSLRDQIYVSFDLLRGLSSDVLSSISEVLIAGLGLIIQTNRTIIKSQTEWGLTFELVRVTVTHPNASKQALEIMSNIVTADHITADNIGGLIAILDDFGTAAGLVTEKRRNPVSSDKDLFVQRGCKAVELMYEVRKVLPRLADTPQRWEANALPILVSFSHQSANPSRDLRHSAINHFQRILLSPQTLQEATTPQVYVVFDQAIFPLIQELLDPDVHRRDPHPHGMPETRMKASALLCRVFLYYLDRLTPDPEAFTKLWLQVLDFLNGLMHIDHRHQLYEAVPESLKNVLLVMNTSGALRPPSMSQQGDDEAISRIDEEVQRRRWGATKERLESFLPGFLDEVIPTLEPALATAETLSSLAPAGVVPPA